MNPTLTIVLLFAARPIMALAAGEVAVRYFFWWYALSTHRKERYVLAPVVLGVAVICAAMFFSEAQWVVTRVFRMQFFFQGQTPEMLMPASPISVGFTRLATLLGLYSLLYPLALYSPNMPKRTTAMEVFLRFTLMTLSGISGGYIAMVYLCAFRQTCFG